MSNCSICLQRQRIKGFLDNFRKISTVSVAGETSLIVGTILPAKVVRA